MFNRLTSRLEKWLKGEDVEPSYAEVPVMPDAPFVAIGDIHGCYEPLRKLITRLDAVTEGDETAVFVGDYVDRGPRSREVLSWLLEMNQTYPEKVICLMGNHERMLLDFLDDPVGRAARWFRNGGFDTLDSFGVVLRDRTVDPDVALEIAHALEAAMPEGMLDWLRCLPLRWSSGNVHCVHAALSPRRAPDDQPDKVLLWGHHDFMNTPRDDGQFVVHGHTIVSQAGVTGSRISIDTGCYRTGRLSAVRVEPGACVFKTT